MYAHMSGYVCTWLIRAASVTLGYGMQYGQYDSIGVTNVTMCVYN